MGGPLERQLLELLSESGIVVESALKIDQLERREQAATVMAEHFPHAEPELFKLYLGQMLVPAWAARVTFPHMLAEYWRLVRMFEGSKAHGGGYGPRDSLLLDIVASSICAVPNPQLWPHIVELTLAPESEIVRPIFIQRLGRFRAQADEVLDVLEQLLESDSLGVQGNIADALRRLGDPRGMALLHRVRDLGPEVLRKKAAAWERLEGR